MLTPVWQRSRTRTRPTPRRREHRNLSCRLGLELLEERSLLSIDAVLQFNQAALAAIRNEKPVIGFLTRDLAIVHSAIFDAVNAVDHTSTVFHVQATAPAGASADAAAAAAGLFTGSALFPTDAALFQNAYKAVLAAIPDGQAKTDGIAVGRFVAEQTLIQRATDGANALVTLVPGTNPGDWRPAPPGFAPAQTPQWPNVTPFALDSGSQFRPPPPPSLTSAAYTASFNEVKDLGRVDSTTRTAAQTEVARFWEGKAGTPQIPGYWNLIAESAAVSQGNTLDQNARLFAELNVSLADEAIAFFDAKYAFNRWRPVTAIQLADQTGNPNTTADPTWMPLLNTAAHPSYVSAHGGTSGAAAAVLADFFGTDNISVSLTSEDLKGVTHSFSSFSAAATEALNSVVWGGVHFRLDNVAGQAQGQAVAHFVEQNFFRPAARGGDLAAVASGASSTLFAVGADHSLFEHTNANGFVKIGNFIQQISAATEASGNAVVFAVTTNQALARFDASLGWQVLGAPGTIASISTGRDAGGRADVFVLTTDGNVAEFRGSGGWVALSNPPGGKSSIVQLSAVDQDRVVAVTVNHSVQEFDPHFGWFLLSGPGFAQSASAVVDGSGQIVTFAQTPDGALLVHRDATGWTAIGGTGTIATISAGTDAAGQADVVAATTANTLAEFRVPTGWMTIAPAGASAPAQLSATAADLVFVTRRDGSVFGEDPAQGIFNLAGAGFAIA